MKVSETRFGTLLKVREHQEKKAQQELTQIRTTREEAQGELCDLDNTRKTEIANSPQAGKIKATDLQTSRAFLRRLSKEIQQQQQKVENIQKQEDSKRTEVVERSQEKEMIVRLEEKYQTHVTKERDRKEQRMVDVLAQRVRATM